MKFMITKKSSGAVTNCSQIFRYQKEVNFTGKKEDPIASKKLVRVLQCHLHKKNHFTNERKWKFIHAHPPDGGDLANAVSKTATKMVRHYDQDERQPDVSMHRDTSRPVLLKAFAKQGARDFSDNFRLHLIHEGRRKKRVEYCLDNKKSLCYLFTSYPGTLWWYST